MTFKHKLSARLARLWWVLSIPGIFSLLSCELLKRGEISGPAGTGPVASVEVTPPTADVSVSSTLQLTAVAKDSTGAILSDRSMTWSTSNTLIASVAAGLVTGLAAGTAQIAATVDGKSDTATVTVIYTAVASVTVLPDVAFVAVDGNYQLSAILKDAGGSVLAGREVAWSSSNPALATVSSSGMAHGVALGDVTITAVSEGISGTAALTVHTPPSPGQCGPWPAGITTWVQPLGQSTGQAYYVSPTGSDANPGTLAQPWQSLAKANTLQPGEILYLRAGTYGARGTTFTFSRTGTPAATITLAGYPGDSRPIIQGRVFISGQWLRVTGMIFDGPTGNVGGPGPSGEAVLVNLSGQHLELSNSEVRHDYWHAGIGGASNSGLDYRILNNYIHDNGGYLGNYDDDQWNTSHGLYMSPSSYGLIANNVIEHNDAKGFMARHDAHHLIIANNTFVANGRHGVSSFEMAGNWIVANNIILNNANVKGGEGASMDGAGGNQLLRRNVFWNNGQNGQKHWSGTFDNSEPLIADPKLVRPATYTPQQDLAPNWDNQPLADSPAIGYADPNYALPFDITGKCRGAAPDAGAYQR